jgi:tripartite-type tricarboxylate transporter receptor subunit TctC
MGASLSVAAGADHRRLSSCRRRRHHRAPYGALIIENRPGAASNIATEAVVRAPADGYTLLLITNPNVINATLYDKLNYNFIRDIAPIASIDRVPNVMEINPSVPADTVPEFITYAKANPGKINMGSGGNGTSQHVSGELFKMMTGIDMQHVPYRGAGLALNDLLAGQVQIMFDTVSGSIGHITAGKLRALAVTTATRSQALPDIPTVGDFVPGYESKRLVGVGAPKITPPRSGKPSLQLEIAVAATGVTHLRGLCRSGVLWDRKLIGHLPLTLSKPVNSIIRAKILLHPG